MAENFIPLAGEIIIYEDNETGKPFGFKIGNGKLNQETGKIEGTKVNDLPFSIENIAIHNGNGENAIQQELRSETFTLVNEYVNSNTEVQKADNGEIIAGALGFHTASFNGRSQALGKGAFAEGVETVALGKYSHAQGNATFAAGGNAHSEGLLTSALGESSHAEGNSSVTEGEASHAEGYYTKATGAAAHSEGFETQAIGSSSHTEGSNTQATADSAHAEGGNTIASGEKSHAEGLTTKAIGNNSHAEGDRTEAHGAASHSEGINTKALKDYSHSEGSDTEANGISAHAEGVKSKATENYSHAEGNNTIASGEASHSEGSQTNASGQWSHAEGYWSKAKGIKSHAEGWNTEANGEAAHAEGTHTYAATFAHAEGGSTRATGASSHAEGSQTLASGQASHAGGEGTIASALAQTAIGKWNSPKENTLFEVGNGGTPEGRQNAFEVYQDGHAEVQKMGETDNSVATRKFVLENTPEGMIGQATEEGGEIFNDYAENKAGMKGFRILRSEFTQGSDEEYNENLIPFPYEFMTDFNGTFPYVKEINGITVTVNEDRSIVINGTITYSTQLSLCDIIIPSTDHFLSGCPTDGEPYSCALHVGGSLCYDTGDGWLLNYEGEDFVGDETGLAIFLDEFYNSGVFNNVVFYPKYEKGDHATSFYPPAGPTLTCELEGTIPQQDVEYNENLIPFPYEFMTDFDGTFPYEKVIDGVAITVNKDRSIALNGTPETWFSIRLGEVNLENSDYYVSGGVDTTASHGYEMNFPDLGLTVQSTLWVASPERYIPLEETLTYGPTATIDIGSGYEMNNLIFKPKLEKGDHATSFYPPKPSLALDDVVSLRLNWNHMDVGAISAIEGSNVAITLNGDASNYDASQFTLKSLETQTKYPWYNTLVVNKKPEVGNIVVGICAHTEGLSNEAYRVGSHAEGWDNIVYGDFGHAEGQDNIAYYCAHVEGRESRAIGEYSHAEGRATIAEAQAAHAEGYETTATELGAHAEGQTTIASGLYSHAEGQLTQAINVASHSEGYSTKSKGKYSHAEGSGAISEGDASHAEGGSTRAIGIYSHSEGETTYAQGRSSHAEGNGTTASGAQGHSEGTNTLAGGQNSHSEGNGSKATGSQSHAEGWFSTASGSNAHAEGSTTKATAAQSHAEGNYSQATGVSSHAEGEQTYAKGQYAHSEGFQTVANGGASHTNGRKTEANYDSQTVVGRANKNKSNTLFEVGNGTVFKPTLDETPATGKGYYTKNANGNYTVVKPTKFESGVVYYDILSNPERSNAFEVYEDGHAEVQTQGTSDKSVVTKGYFDANSGKNLFKHLIEMNKFDARCNILINQTNISTVEAGAVYEVTCIENNLEYNGLTVSNHTTNSSNLIVYCQAQAGRLHGGGSLNISYSDGTYDGIYEWNADDGSGYIRLPSGVESISYYGYGVPYNYSGTLTVKVYKITKTHNFEARNDSAYTSLQIDGEEGGVNKIFFIENPNQVISDYSQRNMCTTIANIITHLNNN